MGQKIFGLQPSQRDLWDKAIKQGYVYIKSASDYIAKDEIDELKLETVWYHVFLHQKTYGIKWALTREELE